MVHPVSALTGQIDSNAERRWPWNHFNLFKVQRIVIGSIDWECAQS
jgi:hypothetical protein